jgi:ATP-dependent DNA helicase RecG
VVIVDVVEFEEILAELRHVGTDHQTIEAKKAAGGLPTTTSDTLSAFANTTGGLLLFGVDEDGGRFQVTGVREPSDLQSALQALCAEMEPPLRPLISIVPHTDGDVVVAELAAIPRGQRPCHRAHVGAYNGSYIRVGDADQLMTAAEVDELRSAATGSDDSARPAGAGSDLDVVQLAAVLARIRAGSTRLAAFDDDQLCAHLQLRTAEGEVTLAGLLTVGSNPAVIAAGSVSYVRHPRAGDPEGTRMAADVLEGPLPVLLDDVLARLAADLGSVQVVRGGAVLDESDAPREALRELVGNALVHRSLSTAMVPVKVRVEVFPDAVVITSPGCLLPGRDAATLGLDVLNSVRNQALVRVAAQLRSPLGNRVIENAASGIKAADEACRMNGTLPPLFSDQPSQFEATLVRGRLDVEAAEAAIVAAGARPDPDMIRLLAVAQRIADLDADGPAHRIGRPPFDARFAARALAPSRPEDAAVVLRRLQDAGLLERGRSLSTPVWRTTRNAAEAATSEPAPPTTDGSDASTTPAPGAGNNARLDRVPDLLAAIAASPAGEMRPKDIATALALSSPTSRNRWISRAIDKGLIEATRDSQFDPAMAYRLTAAGRAQLRRPRRAAGA